MMWDVVFSDFDVWRAKKCDAASKKFALTLGPKRRRVQAIIE